mgnify:CR=1 FL=1
MPRKSRVNPNLIADLYWRKMKSTVEISKILKIHRATVFYHLKKFEKPLRDRIKVVSESARKRQKYPRLPFSGNSLEKQYLLGLSEDLSVERRSKWCIIASLTTSKESMMELFERIFSKYGRILKYKIRNTPYWRIAVYLHQSFKFLLKSNRDYNIANLSRDELLYRVSGLIDAEGSLIITKNSGKYIVRHLVIGMENKNFLIRLARRLNKEFKINCKTYRMKKKGEISKIGKKIVRYNRELWILVINRKKDLKKFLPLIKLQNKEKDKKRRFILETINLIQWKEIRNLYERD